MSRWKEQKEAEKKPTPKADPNLADFEKSSEEGMEQLHEAFRARAAREEQRVIDVVNCDYYFVVCFSNRDQLYEFCEKTGLNPNEIYFNGKEFARKMNRAISTPDTEFPKVQPFNKEYVKRAMDK